ncbi:sugar phosphate nucleotidyltransferase [Paracoccus liaowanqingii]|nr:sugar phosphate nucleotidyltransferase [Paracoccus liaowanqingii]
MSVLPPHPPGTPAMPLRAPMTPRATPAPDMATLLLAGGKGTRLHDLTARDSKPAVPFAGSNRIIDFAMANAVRSGLRRMLVATQYAPRSLHHHLPTRWGDRFEPRGLQTRDGRDLYQGTADAARRCWAPIEAMGGDQVLILAADHVYDMDYGALLAAHRASGAAVTVAVDTVPRAEATEFGVMQADATGRILTFREKPADPAGMIGDPGRAMVSMGIYVFDRAFLRAALFDRPAPAMDFGHDVIPDAVAQGQAAVWQLPAGPSGKAYWRDVGTLDALRRAQLDFIETPPARLPFACPVTDWYLGQGSIAMPGAVVPQGARLTNSLVAPGTQVPAGLVTGDDPDEDARWFTRTDAGTVLITQAMLDRRAAHAHIRRSVTSPAPFKRRGLHA